MYALIFLIFNLFFTLLYYLTKSNYKGINTFLDALYYAMNLSSTLGYGNIAPITKFGKIATIVHSLLVYLSISKFFFLPRVNFYLFAFVNLIVIGGMAYVYKLIDSNLGESNVDFAYFSTLTHTTTGFSDQNKSTQNNTKFAVMAHVILVFLLLNNYNGGIFSTIQSMIFKNSNANMHVKFT